MGSPGAPWRGTGAELGYSPLCLPAVHAAVRVGARSSSPSTSRPNRGGAFGGWVVRAEYSVGWQRVKSRSAALGCWWVIVARLVRTCQRASLGVKGAQ